ncbi:Ser-Thr-rich glycosyl-phosphatidyl-inositol-anchored membrane family-domain-containing protein [Aspergillus pseudodeflectus]|uniref:Ser-Thr-rich glycosyl-phosphatidyl-inositol-anchored membrane family-domain-containing protein n=1 Tax=Aspergillus pseudodeflectus TaxID=176178 RepID=A0ABR4K917_9EURO
MIKFISSALLLSSLAAAISITEPSENSTYAAGSTVTVKWSTVDTDPSTFSLFLWNFVSWPPTYVPLAYDIPTTDESHTVQIPCDTNPEWGYQISAINGTNVYIIYAQGDKFSISEPAKGSHCADTDPVPPPFPTGPSATTCDATTVYITVSPSGSTIPHHSHHHNHHHSHPAQAPSVSSTTTATATAVPSSSSSTSTSSSSLAPSTSHYTKPGNVPKTIGWCSDYSHPVTLDHPPAPTDAPVPPGTIGDDGLVTVIVTATVAVPAPEGDDRCVAV